MTDEQRTERKQKESLRKVHKYREFTPILQEGGSKLRRKRKC